MAKNKSELILPSSAKSSKKDKKPAKKTPKPAKKTAKSNMSLYSSLAYKRRARAEAESRRRAEELAKLPKNPVKRFFAKLHPKRVFKWFFSWRGQKFILKTIAAFILLGIIGIGILFLALKPEVDKFHLAQIHIPETVNTYLDRNGVLLWKDTGGTDYRVLVKKEDIPQMMIDATIAIEDKNFENHIGVDFGALIRAVFSTLTGKGVQGGSTLTQQLIKQVYFFEEAVSENRGGIMRKVKELILAIELEKMSSKDEIMEMYLNQSSYGGRRNGIESAAQTYFGKHASELNLAECALLAAIPNNPAVLDPYNTYGNEKLVERQHKVLDDMVSMGSITLEQAEEAKAIDILATIKPESSQYDGMLAPHFVLEVKKQLEEKYGIQTMRAGGWTITTTLDYRAQKIAEEAAQVGMKYSYINRSDNIAMVSVDVETSQVIAMVGSVDFFGSSYGEFNVAADGLIEPGSSIKPILDYAPLFMKRDGVNYGPGSILRDENIDKIYCNGYTGGACRLRNITNQFYGNVTIRFSLARSLNIAAVKALYINGIDKSLDVVHALGDISYCKDRTQADGVGLSIAIGSGCNVRMVEHANAYASIARGGSYKELSYVLELKNSAGEVIETWDDKEEAQVVDPQVAYMISSILSDRQNRWYNNEGYVVPGVWTATKTGTTTTTNSSETKDSLIESYSTALSTFVWNGNHDGSGLRSNDATVVRFAVGTYMERVHKEVYQKEGKWSPGDEPIKPNGIQTLTVNGKKDIWPSWVNSKNTGVSKESITFNRYNHLLAASCTPEEYKIKVDVTKTTDPMTGKDVYKAPEPYDYDKKDTCDYEPPRVSLSTSGNKIIATVRKGSYDIASYTLYINGTEKTGVSVGNDGTVTGYTLDGSESSVKIIVTDTADYSATSEITLTPTNVSTDINVDSSAD